MAHKEIAPYEGEDGRLYFNFAVGAAYSFKPTGSEPFMLEIIDCEYENGAEYYHLSTNGAIHSKRYTVEQVLLFLSLIENEQIQSGELQELPLLAEEVGQYYNDRAKELSKANAAANATLKGTDYFKLKSELDGLSRPLRFATAKNDEGQIAEIQNKIKEIKAKQAEIINEKGIDMRVLTKACECSNCFDTGFAGNGEICGCAYERAEEIKVYNAQIRMQNKGKLS